MANRPKRHHYVPRFHLGRFADGAGMLTTFDLKTRVSFPQATTKAAAENGFYLLESPEGETSTAAEEALSFAESEAARAFAKVLADDRHRLSVDERIAVAGFVALQAVRTDHVRAQLDELAAGLAKGMPAAFTSATLGSSRSAHIGVMFEVLRPAIERLGRVSQVLRCGRGILRS